MSPFMTSQLTGSAVNTYFHVTTRKDDTTSTRRNRRPLPKPQLQILGRIKPTTDVECSLSPSSPPDSCPRRIPARVNSTPLAHKRAPPLRRPTQCRSEQGDIEEIMCFLNQVLRCVMCVYQAISSTVKWLAVVAFVIETMMMSLGFSVSLLLKRGARFEPCLSVCAGWPRRWLHRPNSRATHVNRDGDRSCKNISITTSPHQRSGSFELPRRPNRPCTWFINGGRGTR